MALMEPSLTVGLVPGSTPSLINTQLLEPTSKSSFFGAAFSSMLTRIPPNLPG
jgi:hypothetical protein